MTVNKLISIIKEFGPGVEVQIKSPKGFEYSIDNVQFEDGKLNLLIDLKATARPTHTEAG